MIKILAINPGSTSTKIGFFHDREKIWSVDVHHDVTELKKIKSFSDEKQFRMNEILSMLKKKKVKISEIDVFAPRGGISMPLKSGTYLVDETLCQFQEKSKLQHPCNLACPIALELAKINNKEAYFTDSPLTYEIMPIAALSGVKEFKRHCRYHALNQKAIAKWHCEKVKKTYDKANLIVAHIGGGISVGAHLKGKVVDVNDGLEEGPFGPERCGALPIRQLIDMCYQKDHSYMAKFIQGTAGLTSYLGMNDMKQIMESYDTDDNVKLVVDAMIYQIAKEIGSRAIALKGKIDGILITGGIAHSKFIVNEIKKYVKFLGPVYEYPGEHELEALAYGAYNVLTKKIKKGEIVWKRN